MSTCFASPSSQTPYSHPYLKLTGKLQISTTENWRVVISGVRWVRNERSSSQIAIRFNVLVQDVVVQGVLVQGVPGDGLHMVASCVLIFISKHRTVD